MSAKENENSVTLDGKTYVPSEMSQTARRIIRSIQLTEKEMARLRGQMAIAETARRALYLSLEKEENEAQTVQ